MLQPVRLGCISFAFATLALATITDAGAQVSGTPRPPIRTTSPRSQVRFRLWAPDLLSRGRIAQTHAYNGMGCTGENISPALAWRNAPAGTRSFAVTAYDPDAPTGSGWWHWAMYNIPATTTSLAAGAGNGRNAPRGAAQGNTDFGSKGYGGPCPPVGDRPHHYHFKVFALKVDRLDVPGNATAAMIGYNLNANRHATSEIIGLYGR